MSSDHKSLKDGGEKFLLHSPVLTISYVIIVHALHDVKYIQIHFIHV